MYLPPDLVTNIRSAEWGTSVRAMIMTFFEIPLLIKIRSPSRMVARLSFLGRLALILSSYHRRFRQAMVLLGPLTRFAAGFVHAELDIPPALR